jgi:hypothetical protein
MFSYPSFQIPRIAHRSGLAVGAEGIAKAPLLIGCGLFLILIMAMESRGATSLDVGSFFPDLVLPSIDEGEPSSVQDFQGKKRIVHIWASW